LSVGSGEHNLCSDSVNDVELAKVENGETNRLTHLSAAVPVEVCNNWKRKRGL
jgi:hypothetical protein